MSHISRVILLYYCLFLSVRAVVEPDYEWAPKPTCSEDAKNPEPTIVRKILVS